MASLVSSRLSRLSRLVSSALTRQAAPDPCTHGELALLRRERPPFAQLLTFAPKGPSAPWTGARWPFADSRDFLLALALALAACSLQLAARSSQLESALRPRGQHQPTREQKPPL